MEKTELKPNEVASVFMSDWDYEYHNPWAEEPSDNIARNHYVTVADHRGNTWVHNWGLSTEKYSFEECRERVQKMVERIEKHLLAGGSINLAHWGEGHPQYGSVAWQRFNIEELQPAAAMVASGYHPENLPDSVRAYF